MSGFLMFLYAILNFPIKNWTFLVNNGWDYFRYLGYQPFENRTKLSSFRMGHSNTSFTMSGFDSFGFGKVQFQIPTV